MFFGCELCPDSHRDGGCGCFVSGVCGDAVSSHRGSKFQTSNSRAKPIAVT